jgi:hypothetical protein
MIKNVFVVTPKYKGTVKGRTRYTKEDGETFVLIRFYETIRVTMIAVDELPDIRLDRLVMGDDIIQFLANRYPGCLTLASMTDFCGIDFSRKMPDDVREKLTADPDYDLDDDGWTDESEDWFYNFQSGSAYADQVLVYSPFVATHTKTIQINTESEEVEFIETIINGEVPLPIERPVRTFVEDQQPIPELSWDGIIFE